MSSYGKRYDKQYHRRFSIVLLAFLFVFALAGPLSAADFRGDETVTISKNEVVDDDLLVAGNIVVIDGVINGDLVAVGSQVTVNGHVKGSLIFAGQIIVLNGRVDGTVYSGAGSLNVGPNATVGRNLFFGGYSYHAEAGSVIGRDNFMGGYQATVNGEVKRNLYVSLAALELNGSIGGNVDAVVGQPGTTIDMQYLMGSNGPKMPPALPSGLRVGPEAKIAGKFNYTSPVDQANAIAVSPREGITYRAAAPQESVNLPPTRRDIIIEWFAARLREVVTLVLLGVLALWLIPTLFSQISEHTLSQTVLSGVWGILVSILGYGGAIFVSILLLAAVVALATMTLAGLATSLFVLGFSSLGVAFTIFSMLVAYGSKLVVLYPLAHSFFERTLPAWNRYRITPLVSGILVYVLLSSIPWFGMLLSTIVTLIGLGAMWMTFRDGFTNSQKATPKLILTPA
jgi:uncharacterized membrane protein/cytoskeletal protein CcmA (bactofilin family)